MTQKTRKEKRKFSSFTPQEAMRWLGLKELTKWQLECLPLAPTPFFAERMRRLEHFDLIATEDAKELVIEAICEDVLEHHPPLRVWKAAPLSSDELTGVADYLVARRQRYIEIPLLCVVEAKKDKFEEGLGQCLVEMLACQWNNRQVGREMAIYGIVTNGDGWRFYQLDANGNVLESALFAIVEIQNVMGALSYVFGKCEENLAQWAQAA